jgi:hypothetical protein
VSAGVDRAVHRFDPSLKRVEHIGMGDVAGVQQCQHFAGGHADQVVHLASPMP